MSYAPTRKGLVSARESIRAAMLLEAAAFNTLASKLESARLRRTSSTAWNEVESVESSLRAMAHGLTERARADEGKDDEG